MTAPGSPRMVSGPDLGGGFLFQLTADPSGPIARFTFHAQDGGSDAGGPPPGDPSPFGWRRSEEMCPLGGRVCWHRVFELPLEETPRVRAAYNRTRFTMEAALGQRYGGGTPPVSQALALVADRLGPALASQGIPWWVGGSAGLLVRGAPIAPRDIDLGTSREGVAAIGGLLEEFLIEPVAPTTRADGTRVVGARAFVGTLRDGVRVEWAVDEADPPEEGAPDEWAAPPRGRAPELVEWEGRKVPVSRPEFALVRSAIRRDAAHLAAAAGAVRRAGADVELLEALLRRPGLSEGARESVRRVMETSGSR